VSYEHFDIPRDIITLCLNKSTYARCGLYVNITPFEPEWRGHATVELTNPTPRAVKVYPFEGIAQLLFLQAGLNHEEYAEMIRQATMDTDITTFDEGKWPGGYYPDTGRLICRRSYADKGGKYQDQEGRIVHPRVDGESPYEN
jgi:deoxycytidine triphosphate deaminase